MKTVKCICKITFIFRGRHFQPGELLWIQGVTDEEYDFLIKNDYVTLCQEDAKKEIEPETTALDSPPEKAIARRGRKRKV